MLNVAIDNKKELRTAFGVLAIFWCAAFLFYLISWRTIAFILVTMGAVAASERFNRIVVYAKTTKVRALTILLWIAVVIVTAIFAFDVFPWPHGSPFASSSG